MAKKIYYVEVNAHFHVEDESPEGAKANVLAHLNSHKGYLGASSDSHEGATKLDFARNLDADKLIVQSVPCEHIGR